MNRRFFLQKLGLVTAAAAVVPDELLDMLKPRRLYVPGVDFGASPMPNVQVTDAEIGRMLKAIYVEFSVPQFPLTPLLTHFEKRSVRRGGVLYTFTRVEHDLYGRS